MRATLRIQLFGAFTLTYGDQQIASMTTPRLQSLLAYLVLHRDAPQTRSHIAYLFWPDATEAQGRNNLRQALHALRAVIPDSATFLFADTHSVRWQPDAPFTLDVADFERAVEAVEASNGRVAANGRAEDDIRRAALERAVGLYTADLLPSCFDEWIAPIREELRRGHLRLLDRLTTVLEDVGDLVAASEMVRRRIQVDPLNEDAYRRLMSMLARRGDRAGAIRAYHACATALRRELDIAPSQQTQEAYERLVRLDGAPVQTPASRPTILSGSSTLIGRQREWEQLVEAWRKVEAGKPAFALVTGEAGIGKSRLAEEFLQWASQQGAMTARGRCYAAEGQLSLAPVTDWLRSDGLRPHLAHLDSIWLTEASRLLPELASEVPEARHVRGFGAVGQRQRLFEALARAVLEAPQPLALLIDDLQWCDDETLEWLHFLLRFGSASRLLVIGTARMEEVAPQHQLRTLLLHLRSSIEVAEVALQPLDAAETARLAGLISREELHTNAALRLYRETEGNPLFVVETVRAGLEAAPSQDVPPPEPGTSASAPTMALPPRVHAVISGRLAQLSAEARELAAVASAIGRAFSVEVLARAANTDEDLAYCALDELWRKRIVRELGASSYDFTHDKLREVAYGEIGSPQRHLLHRRIAQALEAISADDLDALSAQIAAHYERAGLGEQAIPYYQRAASIAQHVYSHEDAIRYLERALELLEQTPGGSLRRSAQELTLLHALAPNLRVAHGWTAPQLERVIYRKLALCETVGTDEQRVAALYDLGSLLTVQAQLERVQEVDEQMRAAYLRAHLTPPPLAGLLAAGAQLHLGHIAEASSACERIIEADDTVEPQDWLDVHGSNHRVHVLAWHAHALWLLGYPDQALRRGAEAVQLAGDLGLPFNEALAATYLALLQQLRADPLTARAQAEGAHTLASQYKAAYYWAWSSVLVRYAEAWDEPDSERLKRLGAAIEEFKATGARLRLPYYLGLQARICRKAQRIEEGLTVIDEALAQSAATNECWWDAELWRMRAELLVAVKAGAEEVQVTLARAREIARSQQALALELRVAISFARLRRGQSHMMEAQRELAAVYVRFTEGYETPDLRRARSLLSHQM